MKKTVTPATQSPFDSALVAFREAEARLRALVDRKAELSAWAESRDRLAQHEEQRRADALALADLPAASEHDRVAREARAAAQEAREEIAVLTPAIAGAESLVVQAEEAANDTRVSVLDDFARAEYAALLSDFRPRVLRVYQARVAGGNYTFPMRVLLDELAEAVDYRQLVDVQPLPVPVGKVRSGLVSFDRRRELLEA